MERQDTVEREYVTRLAARRAVVDGLERRHMWLGYTKVALAGSAVVAPMVFGLGAWPFSAAAVACLLAAAVVHDRVIAARDRAMTAVTFYQRGARRLSSTWAGTGETGDRFRQADHVYADDLDLFGRGSVFELLSTVRTHAGEDTLARWLLEAAPPEEIVSRQQAARELASRLDLRETAAVLGDSLRVGVHAQKLSAWATSPPLLRGGATRVALAVMGVSSAVLLLVGFSTGSRTIGIALTSLLTLQTIVALWFRHRVNLVIPSVESPIRDLELVAGLLRILEQERFTSPRLQHIVAAVGGSERPASVEIARLARLVVLIDSRKNQFFLPFAALLMWATQLAFAVEAWRTRTGARVPGWLETIGEFEALCAIGTYAYEHPGYVFPDLLALPAQLAAEALAHPLLPAGAVANDVALGGDAPHLLVVSGSNMSGKSTLLRTVGVSVVLAQAGAPVRATRFSLSPLAVGGTLRIQDSLQDGRSRFMAEITRLRQIVDLTKASHGAVLFLIDEILAGTNSHDRREGAEAILAGLVAIGAVGMVTTHDLALGQVADRMAPRAANVHFEDRFEDGVLHFDYQLRPGIVKTSNALALMRSIGLDV